MTTTPNKWTFWFFWIAGNTLAWGLGFAAGFAFYWWVGERNFSPTFALPMIVIVLGFQWGILRYSLRGHPAYESHPEKYVPVGPSFVVAPLAVYLFSISMMSNDVIWSTFSWLATSLIFTNSFLQAEFFTRQRSPLDNYIPLHKAIGTLVLFVILGVLGWQFSKLLFFQAEASSNEFAIWMGRNLLLGSVLGLIYSAFSIWGLRTIWNYEAFGEEIFFNIDGKAVLKNRRKSRWQWGGFFILLMGWGIWVALRPCNRLDRLLGQSDCLYQFWNLRETGSGFGVMSRDGKLVAYQPEKDEITLWSVQEKKALWSIHLEGDDTFRLLEFSNDGSELVGYGSETGERWQVSDGRLIEEFERSREHNEIIINLPPEPTLVSGLSGQQLWMWNFKNILVMKAPDMELMIKEVVTTPTGATILAKGDDDWQIWILEDEKLNQIYDFDKNKSPEPIISSDGEMIAIVNQAGDGIKIFDIKTGSVSQLPIKYDISFVWSQIHLNSNYLIFEEKDTRTNTVLTLWHISDGEMIGTIRVKNFFRDVFLSADSDVFVIIDSKTFQLWKFPSPQP